jgi:hypothetical protein
MIVVFAATASGSEVTTSSPSHLAEDNQTDNLAEVEFASPEQAAQTWIDTLKQLRPGDDVQEYTESLGFGSAAEVSKAEVGRPLRLYRILDLSKAMAANTPMEKMLTDTRTEMVPLLVGEHARSAIVVSSLKNDTAWKLTSMGYREIVPLLEKYRTARTSRLITISSLGLRFLGEGKDAELVLIPMEDSYGLKPGTPVPAREIFYDLARRFKHDQPASNK